MSHAATRARLLRPEGYGQPKYSAIHQQRKIWLLHYTGRCRERQTGDAKRATRAVGCAISGAVAFCVARARTRA